MRGLAYVLGAILALLGIAVGGCALVFLGDSIVTGIEGFGFGVFVLASAFFLIATGLLSLAWWIFRRASREPVEPDSGSDRRRSRPPGS